MATPTEPRREHPSTYVVQDRSNEEEMNRLLVQDQMVTNAMGGVLPEQHDPNSFRRILDVGCGTGGWIIETALQYPDVALFGIDISVRMLDYARAQVVEKGLADRVEFRVMDALRMLEYPKNYFDLVNIRSCVSWMRKWDWPNLLREVQRVTRAGGVIRITEPNIIQVSNSPALTRWSEMALCALFQAGHLFEKETAGLTAYLVPLFTQHGVQNVQTRAYNMKYYASSVEGQRYIEDFRHLFRTLRPFVQKWGCLSPDYDAICKQAVEQMQQSDFQVTWDHLTVWGTVPAMKEQKLPMTEHH